MQHNEKFPANTRFFFSSLKPDLQGIKTLRGRITLNQTWAGFKVIFPSCGINLYLTQFTGHKLLFYRKWNQFAFLLHSSDGRPFITCWPAFFYFSLCICGKANTSSFSCFKTLTNIGIKIGKSLIFNESRCALHALRCRSGLCHQRQIGEGCQFKISKKKK